ncbi:MAG: prepilin-type N-terminal cleavage/methylation domain-containing protein [Candidatus Omnitrophota bacterium]
MKKGFTLLELLIGITIFAIISGAVYTSLYLGIKVWKNEERNNSSVQEIMLCFGLLEKSLHSTFLNPDNENIKFKGSLERLEFFAVNQSGQLEAVSFYLEPAGTSGKDLFRLLVLRQKPGQEKEQTESIPEVVNNRISAFKLSYFDQGKNQWFEDWPEELAARRK